MTTDNLQPATRVSWRLGVLAIHLLCVCLCGLCVSAVHAQAPATATMPAIADPPVFPAWYGRLSEADRATLRRTIEAVDLRYRASVEWLGFRVRNYCLVAPDSPTVKTLQEQTDNLQSVANQAASKASQALQRVQATEQRLAAIEARMDAVAAAASRPAGK